jgi:sigma-E factor negative regulatory protein RseC
MREKGSVSEIAGPIARVIIEPSAACAQCPACGFCVAGTTGRVLEVENTLHARAGDEVLIEISTRKGLLASFIVFGLPILLGLAGILVGNRFGETIGMVCGVGGLALGLAGAKIVNDLMKKHNRLLPRIVEIVRRN